ncbi:SH3-like domain-containing protein [Yoonia sediminilitoris]|uniref:Nitrile hydratase n=1 Tax=Yoonia sediminilitoris TaxID=1286148 RepID=A0A2T6KM77_9RHOB|nr:SH3-like domain-containing protein [Yoonia sediminilitoris]PUB17320.1 nitrile hydratase [Yoonia sediminilitoris]RCW97615.1 nitrile hydratase [Yoonia sediminilitoris]
MTRFSAGDIVTVLALGKRGHVRIPHYIRHQTGEIVGYCGTYLNPEDLAVGNTGSRAIDLYRVAFAQTRLWPDEDHPAQDRLIIEIYDHWLAPAAGDL